MKRILKWLQGRNEEVRVLFNGRCFTGYIFEVKRKFFSMLISFDGMNTVKNEKGIFPIKGVAIFYDIK